jgi:hypothetical protein
MFTLVKITFFGQAKPPQSRPHPEVRKNGRKPVQTRSRFNYSTSLATLVLAPVNDVDKKCRVSPTMFLATYNYNINMQYICNIHNII